MDVTPSYEEGDTIVYNMELRFTDLFGRERCHTATLDLPKGQAFEERISFTAISSVNMRVGVVERVESMFVRIMLFGGEFVQVASRKDHQFEAGMPVCVIEHMNIADPDQMLEYVALPHPLEVNPDDLRLQSVNADVLDASGNLLYRLSADPILKRKSYAARVAA